MRLLLFLWFAANVVFYFGFLGLAWWVGLPFAGAGPVACVVVYSVRMRQLRGTRK